VKLIYNGFPIVAQATAEECAACATALFMVLARDSTEFARLRHQYDVRSLATNKWAEGKPFQFQTMPEDGGEPLNQVFELVED
jgi:hypothetical protein